ncbi:MAG: hypothetical protein AMJ90_05405 [candidate division Zixibacteria bacterium SM23_73_2]|nr:MAG: hypothetical protein AMJ90_05405 [candidate division Zixibacteria bacterium SM23_73_2]
MFEEMVRREAQWLSGEGKNSDIVLSSRVRLARNIRGVPFPTVADADTRQKVLSYVKIAIEKSESFNKGMFHSSSELSPMDKNFLLERHLVSPEFVRDQNGFRGIFIGRDEKISIMVNEEDHLRTQAIKSGLEIKATWQEANRMDDELSKFLEFDFDSDFGYLTSCPTNVGTGIRASVLIHLPGLVLTKEVEKVISRITKMGLSVRGFYGEGTDVLGNLFQISNQTTLGKSEEDIVESLEKITQQIIEYEGNSRVTLFRDAREQIEDKIWRAYGILRYARVLTSDEVMNLLSALRLGIRTGTLSGIDLRSLNQLLILTQPAHLQKYFGSQMNADQRDKRRAEILRERLN